MVTGREIHRAALGVILILINAKTLGASNANESFSIRRKETQFISAEASKWNGVMSLSAKRLEMSHASAAARDKCWNGRHKIAAWARRGNICDSIN